MLRTAPAALDPHEGFAATQAAEHVSVVGDEPDHGGFVGLAALPERPADGLPDEEVVVAGAPEAGSEEPLLIRSGLPAVHVQEGGPGQPQVVAPQPGVHGRVELRVSADE